MHAITMLHRLLSKSCPQITPPGAPYGEEESIPLLSDMTDVSFGALRQFGPSTVERK